MSELHEKLDSLSTKKGFHATNVFIFNFLKDIAVDTMVRQ